MAESNRLRWVISLLSILALASPLAARDHEGVFEQSLRVSGPSEVEVTASSGDIDVRPGDGGSVHVRGIIKVDRGVKAEEAERIIKELVAHPPIEQSGNHIRIGQIKDWKLGGLISISFDHHPFSISYELVVPAETRLTAETGSGDQRVSGLKGPVNATAGSGSMNLSSLGGGVRAVAGSGTIEVSSTSGMVDVQTGSGGINATGIAGPVNIHAGSGNVTLEQVSQDAIEIETGSGDVEIRGAQGTLRARAGSGSISVSGQPGGGWKLETGSGDVTLRLPPHASFELEAHTGSGSIESAVAITMRGKMERNELKGTAGAGGPLINVRTGSGDVRIE